MEIAQILKYLGQHVIQRRPHTTLIEEAVRLIEKYTG
jgi:hypothetical protein